MDTGSQTGTRLRAQRIASGLKQADLARQTGISASYLNLIEHNRRRIAGKLLTDIARVLGVDPKTLSDGVGDALIAEIDHAAQSVLPETSSGLDATDLATQLPDWAQVVAAQNRRIEDLQTQVATLSDQLTHDPFLFDTLHELLSASTAIHSTASILAEPTAMGEVRRRRFTENLATDSHRLKDAGQALSQYLDAEAASAEVLSPLQEVEQALHENPNALKTPNAINALSPSAQDIAAQMAGQAALDQMALPDPILIQAIKSKGIAPDEIARMTFVPLTTVMRRLASLTLDEAGVETGKITCDGSGALLSKRPPAGFAIPNAGAPCANWPLFTALQRPNQPVHYTLEIRDRLAGTPLVFDAYAIAEAVGPQNFNGPQTFQATMLVARRHSPPQIPPVKIGPTCRLCPVKGCPARREPSVLS